MSPTLRGRRTRRRIDRLGIATDQDSRLDARAARRVLVRVLDETRRVGVDFRVCGTAGAQLQGVDLEADDVDLLFRNRDDLDSFAAALRRFPRPRGPLYLEDSRQYFVEFVVDGVSVELSTVEFESSSNARECVGEGAWIHCRSVRCGSHDVRAVALELRLATEVLRARRDRSATLVAHLSEHGCDHALLGSALEAAGVAPDVRLATLDAVGADR
jgi:hypothetical protein